jgi:Ca2+/Na+ antiporter
MRTLLNRAWAVAIAIFAMHNLEEAIAIKRGWTAQHFPSLSWAVDKWSLFAGAAALLTMVVISVAYLLRKHPQRSRAFLRAFLVIMLANAVWHVGVSVYVGTPAPGVYTAVLLIAPVYAYLLWRTENARAARPD